MPTVHTSNPPVGWQRSTLGLRRFRIGTRLRLVFGCIFVLMFLGSSFSLWYVRAIRQDVENVSLVEQRMSAVLEIDNSVLILMNRLHRSADLRQRNVFEADAARLLEVFRADIAAASGVLRAAPPGDSRQKAVYESLNGLLEVLPDRVGNLVELARAEDWAVVESRLLNQVDRTDDVVAELVATINRDLVADRQRLRLQVLRAELHMAGTLAGTGLLTLLLAVLLGIAVTRSITRPLATLDAGTRALAEGHFGGRVTVTETDELSHLARAFNQMAYQLEELYGRLRLSEARFRSLIENASEMILIVSQSGRILYASPSTGRILGAPPEQFVGRPVPSLLDPAEAQAALQVFRKLSEHPGATQTFELRVRHKDGSHRWVEGLAANLLTVPAVAGVVINARDVSERRRSEALLRERDEQLRQAQKMEAIGQLAGGVAHDFNNLLTVINGYSELMLASLDPVDRHHAYAKDIRDAGEQAANLTRQLLAFGRKQMLNPAAVNLNDIVRETDRMLRRVIGEDIQLVCDLDPTIAMVEADWSQLQQVLMNLAVNARDAMPGGGRLTIQTGEVPAGEVSGLPCPCVTLTVTDTGKGMDEATRARVFEPFFTTKGIGKGTGLGLSTVYGIVSQSGGRVEVRSEVDRGTAFVIYLPKTQQPAGDQGQPVEPPAALGRETVLLVEDQAEVRNFACQSLESFGYRVLTAADAEEALRVAESSEASIDVLLTDVVMPGMNGVELSQRLLSIRPGLKVIFASGYADNVTLHLGVEATDAAFLLKPYGPGTLATKIREVLES